MSEAATIPETAAPPSASSVEESLYEVVNGLILEKPLMGAREALIATALASYLFAWRSTSHLGRIANEALFFIDPAAKLKRRPDVAYVSYERWPRQTPVRAAEAWDVVPDLAIEINSPSNSGDEVQGKIQEYFRAGVRQVWVVYPITRLIYVYSSPTTVQILQPGDDLDGGPVLPGFRVAVSSLFEDELADA